MGLSGASAYAKTGTTSGVENADPHRLIQMLIDGAIEKINRAKFFLNNQKTADKGQNISWAISIIGGLRSSLDLEQGGEVAANLDALYDYCCVALVEANVENDEVKLDSVLNVMKEIKEGWDGIRQQAIQAQGE